ncbi:MAG: hypothetical protein M1835_003883, partial [Candelina submexicana]
NVCDYDYCTDTQGNIYHYKDHISPQKLQTRAAAEAEGDDQEHNLYNERSTLGPLYPTTTHIRQNKTLTTISECVKRGQLGAFHYEDPRQGSS